MSKTGAAKKADLGVLHNTLTKVFTKVLQGYERQLDAELDVEADMIDELVDSGVTINPAMLTAISKFLKDNEVMFDSEEIDELSSLERRLQDKKKQRDNVVSLKNIQEVGNG